MQYLGGGCLVCGYSRRLGLTFHHRDKKTKSFTIAKGLSFSWQRLKKEIDKCDLLCGNCHAELHFNEEKTQRRKIRIDRARFHKIKQECLDYRGGICVVCGYNKCQAALHFHHRDPLMKKFELGSNKKPLRKVKDELDKCDILCANCHLELHS